MAHATESESSTCSALLCYASEARRGDGSTHTTVKWLAQRPTPAALAIPCVVRTSADEHLAAVGVHHSPPPIGDLNPIGGRIPLASLLSTIQLLVRVSFRSVRFVGFLVPVESSVKYFIDLICIAPRSLSQFGLIKGQTLGLLLGLGCAFGIL